MPKGMKGFQKGNKINLGKHHSGETKEKMSFSHQGEKNSMYGVHRYGKNAPGYGKKHSEETKQKLKKIAKERFKIPENNPMYGIHRFGKQAPSWNGGRRKQSEGYIAIYSPAHPFCSKRKDVYEHRLVMEKHLGRYLKPEEIVHHINEIVNDNRLENLMLFKNKSEHKKFHS